MTIILSRFSRYELVERDLFEQLSAHLDNIRISNQFQSRFLKNASQALSLFPAIKIKDSKCLVYILKKAIDYGNNKMWGQKSVLVGGDQ